MNGLIALAAAAASMAQPHPLKTFGDWIVGCDNGRACQANALFPEDDTDSSSSMMISRGPQASGPTVIELAAANDGVVVLAADGKKLAVRMVSANGTTRVHPGDVAAFIEGVKPARKLEMFDARGKEVAHVSLSGLNAALLYMDDQQKRVGSVTALIRKGAKPAAAIPAPPALPVINVPAVPRLAAKSLRKADIARILKTLECGEPEGTDAALPTYARLDARTSLAMIPWPCGNGAYNYFTYALTVDNAGKATPAKFDASTGFGPEDDGSLVNAEWDEKLRLLTTYAKGRGIGDCGTAQTFA